MRLRSTLDHALCFNYVMKWNIVLYFISKKTNKQTKSKIELYSHTISCFYWKFRRLFWLLFCRELILYTPFIITNATKQHFLSGFTGSAKNIHMIRKSYVKPINRCSQAISWIHPTPKYWNHMHKWSVYYLYGLQALLQLAAIFWW